MLIGKWTEKNRSHEFLLRMKTWLRSGPETMHVTLWFKEIVYICLHFDTLFEVEFKDDRLIVLTNEGLR